MNSLYVVFSVATLIILLDTKCQPNIKLFVTPCNNLWPLLIHDVAIIVIY